MGNSTNHIDENKLIIEFIKKNCPNLKGQELLDAADNFRQYIEICFDIYHRIAREEKKNNCIKFG